MKYLHTFLLLFLAITAMAQKINPEKKAFSFATNKTIMFDTTSGNLFPEIKDGNMLVFTYDRQAAEDPQMSDDEFHESIIFEVNPTWRNFTFKTKLPISKATYNMGCFCAERGYYAPHTGTIKGRKLADGCYWIEADLHIKYPAGSIKRVTFKGKFCKTNAH